MENLGKRTEATDTGITNRIQKTKIRISIDERGIFSRLNVTFSDHEAHLSLQRNTLQGQVCFFRVQENRNRHQKPKKREYALNQREHRSSASNFRFSLVNEQQRRSENKTMLT